MTNVSLTPAMEQEIEKLVASGEYASASEVLRDGFRLLKERRERGELYHEWMIAQIELGWLDIDMGRTEPHDMQGVVSEVLTERDQR